MKTALSVDEEQKNDNPSMKTALSVDGNTKR